MFDQWIWKRSWIETADICFVFLLIIPAWYACFFLNTTFPVSAPLTTANKFFFTVASVSLTPLFWCSFVFLDTNGDIHVVHLIYTMRLVHGCIEPVGNNWSHFIFVNRLANDSNGVTCLTRKSNTRPYMNAMILRGSLLQPVWHGVAIRRIWLGIQLYCYVVRFAVFGFGSSAPWDSFCILWG